MQKKAIIFGIKLLITVGLFVLLFRPQTFGLRADLFGAITPGKLIDEIRQADARNVAFWLGFAAIVKLAGMLAGVLRWRLLLQGQGLKMPFWYMVQSWFIGRTIGIFLPGTLGLDGYRLYDSARYTGEVIKSTTVIAIEKLIGIIAMTLLVLITFPLGYHLLNFNIPMLILSMTVFGGLVVVSFLTLLNPRVIQIVVAAIPTPPAIRNKLDKLGAAATAYSGNRKSLLLAVVFGVLVHVGTCLMYFGTMTAIRAENTTIFDIFFTSPLMIWGTVLGPTVGGEGIREIVFISVLGSKSGELKAFLIAHLGWWVGELVPFLIGLPIFLLRSRPDKDEVQAELADARRVAAEAEAESRVHLAPEEVARYRNRLINCVLAGVLAGLIAGAVIGLAETTWVVRLLGGLEEYAAFWWGPLMYGLAFTGAGLGIAGGLAFLYLLFDRFPKPGATFGLCLGGSLGMGTLVIGGWRVYRDIHGQHIPPVGDIVKIALVAAAVFAVTAGIASVVVGRVRGTRKHAVSAGLAAFLVLMLSGVVASKTVQPAPHPGAALSDAKATGPNIIFIVADACRADAFSMYSEDAKAKTPSMDMLRGDGILFSEMFSQASWTKPAFGTIFSGRYPRSHTAVSKATGLPDEVVTFPEIMVEGGYYTKAFANNPNIAPTYNFQQGFADYTYLEPNLVFWASPSGAKLSIYEGLRRVPGMVAKKTPGFLRGILFGGLKVTDFYHPAEAVTRDALEWIENDAPKDRPFMLFVHYMDTHDPFMDWENPGVGYARRDMESPAPEHLEPMLKAYDLEVEYMDRHIGGLLKGLADLGMYDDAVVVFTSDHGEEFYDHEGWWHGTTLYDELIRVPLVVKLPKKAAAGGEFGAFARHIDLAPTLLHFGGLMQDEAMPGSVLMSIDGALATEHPGYVYAENDFEGNVLEATRTHTHKLIRANEDNRRDLEPVEFYDLSADPTEQKNVAGEGLLEEATLGALLDDVMQFIEEGAAEPQLMQGTAEDLQRLKALGYVGDDAEAETKPEDASDASELPSDL
ncbi:MAG: sulfatase-like hydrolase/transferase [bacterium]|nr:sulfatase-like hydrolase/transferase [bacterium]